MFCEQRMKYAALSMARQSNDSPAILPTTSPVSSFAADDTLDQDAYLQDFGKVEPGQQLEAGSGPTSYAPGQAGGAYPEDSISDTASCATEDSDMSSDGYNTEDEEEENNACPVDDQECAPAAVWAFSKLPVAVLPASRDSGITVQQQQLQQQQQHGVHKQVWPAHTPLTPPSSPACHTISSSQQQLLQQHLSQHMQTLFPGFSTSAASSSSTPPERGSAQAAGSSNVYWRTWAAAAVKPDLSVRCVEPATPVCGLTASRRASVTATPPPSPAGVPL